jgi:acyl-CoA synthetase (AMP-forming)/AMP-acid ligase II
LKISLTNLSISLAAAPIALAGAAGLLAYANARSSLSYDLTLAKCMFGNGIKAAYRERTQRLNPFYDLEYYAQQKKTANQPVLLYQSKTHTFAQLYDTILRYGHYMKTELGIKPGQVVAMLFDNSDTFIMVWFGLWSIGAKPAFINYNLRGVPLAHCLKVSTANLCFVDATLAEHVDAVKGDVANMQTIALTQDLQTKLLSMPATRAPDSDRAGQKKTDMAVLIYTSGTTGLPKPAIVSWLKVTVGGGVSAQLLGRKSGDVMYTVSPTVAALSVL